MIYDNYDNFIEKSWFKNVCLFAHFRIFYNFMNSFIKIISIMYNCYFIIYYKEQEK